jgi:hypothetical protein
MSLVESSRATLLHNLAQQTSFQSDCAVEGVDSPEGDHQNPAWVRRCVASYISKGDEGTDREAVSKAFAVCRAQYNDMEDPGPKNAAAFKGKKGKKRMGQYEKILAKARMKPG